MKFGFREMAIVLVMLGCLAGSYYFLSRLSDQKAAMRRDILSKQKALADLQHATAGISDLNRKIADLQKAIDFFESKLPKEKQVETILKDVCQLATAHSLTIKTIKPLKTERYARFSEQPIQMSLSGAFEGYYAFLLALEKLPRITRLTQMQLQKIQDKDGQMQAQMTLIIFFEPDGSPTLTVSVQ